MAEQDSTSSSELTVLGAAEQLQALESTKDKSKPAAKKDAPAAKADTSANASDDEDDADPSDEIDEASAEGEEETPTDDEPADEEAEATDEESEAQDDEKPTAKPDDVVFELDVEGKKVPVTREEARLGHLRQQDYTRKTQEVATQRKAVEAEGAQVRQAREQYAAGLAEIDGYLKQIVGQEPDWDKVRAEQPDEYPRLQADWQVTKARLADLRAERQRVADEAAQDTGKRMQARVLEEAKKLAEKIPDYADPVKGKAFHESLRTYGQSIGFTQDEVDNTMDHRLIVMLDKARRYDELQAQKPKLIANKKPLVPKTPVLKPGAQRQQTTNSKAKEQAAAFTKVARSGRMDDAVEAIRALG